MTEAKSPITNRQSQIPKEPPMRVFIAHAPKLSVAALRLSVVLETADVLSNLITLRRFGFDGCDLGIILREHAVTVSVPGQRAVIFELDFYTGRADRWKELESVMVNLSARRQKQISATVLAACALVKLAKVTEELQED